MGPLRKVRAPWVACHLRPADVALAERHRSRCDPVHPKSCLSSSFCLLSLYHLPAAGYRETPGTAGAEASERPTSTG